MNVDNNKQKVTIRLNIFTNINRKMYWCSKILCGLLMVALFKLTDSQTLHVCTNTTGSLCDLLCETTDQSVTISFTDPSTSSAGACLSNGACNSGITGYTASRVNSTFTRLRIDVLTFSRDYGNWSCSYGSSVSTLILLPCPSASDNVTINGENNDKGVNITCESKCQFPVSAYTSLKLHSKDGTLVTTEGSVSGSTPSASDGCENHEQNVILTYMVSSSRFCGNVEFSCSFDSTYLEQQTSDLSRPFKFEDNTWFIILGWILGILIFALVAFLIILAIARKDLTCMLKEWILKLQFGLLFGIAVVLALIICIIIGVLVCWSSLGQAVGVGIGISVGLLIICVGLIYNIIFFNCLKETNPTEKTPKSSENRARSAPPADEANRGLKNNQVSPKKNELKTHM